MSQYVTDGPLGVDPSVATPGTDVLFPVGTMLKTRDTASPFKNRIFRYCKSHAAYVVGEVRIINSNYEATSALITGSTASANNKTKVGSAQVAAASTTGALYGWVQTGGWFDNIGVKDASANKQLFTSATAGYVGDGNLTAQKKVWGLSGCDGATLGAGTTSYTADAFSEEEIFVDPN